MKKDLVYIFAAFNPLFHRGNSFCILYSFAGSNSFLNFFYRYPDDNPYEQLFFIYDKYVILDRNCL